MDVKEGLQLEMTKALCLATIGGYMGWLFLREEILMALKWLGLWGSRAGLAVVLFLLFKEVFVKDELEFEID